MSGIKHARIGPAGTFLLAGVIVGFPVDFIGSIDYSIGSNGSIEESSRGDNSFSFAFARYVRLRSMGVLSELGLANDHITLERSRLEVVPANADRISSQKPQCFCVARKGNTLRPLLPGHKKM